VLTQTVGANTQPIKVLFVFGTRPEAIKLAPVVRRLRSQPARFDVRCCSTGQHRDILRPVLQVFSIAPEYELDVMAPGQTLFQSTARIISAMESVLTDSFDLVVVQGDTTTTWCGALSAFYARIPVAHVEAGLRTYDMAQPFPEEMNRVLTGRIASLHFAATEGAAAALRNEAIHDGIHVTGNTGIDALLEICRRLERKEIQSGLNVPLDPGRRSIVVTTHRRESFGPGLQRTCAALEQIAQRPDVQIVLPVHPNPNVRPVVTERLGSIPNVTLIDPLEYVDFVDLMRRSYLLLTDSGGVQEEAPSLGKPVLVLREKTERPEAVTAGTARLVGTDTDTIVREVNSLLDNAAEYERRSRVHNPYGDGRASDRIADAIAAYFA
jgi:UDP-N-acetylglucosamine 2-epimerase (non-hydrolysing)